MVSPSETPSSKRRLGRRRLPPLEPGPALQFVIANHPDQFRAGKTMRHVRSHVMYKHRIDRRVTGRDQNTNLQRIASAHPSTASSPRMTSSETSVSDVNSYGSPQSRPRSSTWTKGPPQYVSQVGSPHVLRTIIHHILASAQGTFARSAPPAFEDAQAFPFRYPYDPHIDSLEDLKQQYVDSCESLSKEKSWLQVICADQMSFFSHVSITSVYEDLADGLWQDSDMTVQAKTYALRAIAGQLESNDATILSILHLLLSEIGGDETAYQVHHQGLRGLIERRGGVSQLSDRLATYVILQLQTLCILRRVPVWDASYSFVPNPRRPTEPYPYISPLYLPLGTVDKGWSGCSAQTLEIINAMHALTHTFIRQKQDAGTFTPLPYHYLTYERLVQGSLLHSSQTPDWVHESIRLTAILYSQGMLYQTTLATSANAPFQSPSTGNTTLLYALFHAVQQTDVTSCWGDMRGAFLWVCLVGGSASWGITETKDTTSSPPLVCVRKYFSLWAIRTVVSTGFENADGTLEILRTGIKVRSYLDEHGS